MLPAFNMLAASVLALVWLTVGLLFPILAVWFGVRVARDLRRIADAVEFKREVEDAFENLGHPLPTEEKRVTGERVRNSMFGR